MLAQVSHIYVRSRRLAESDDPSALLATLYAEDVREHAHVPPVETAEYVALRQRDRARRERALEALSALREAGKLSPDDLYHTAWLYNHGDDPDEAKLAHELGSVAARRGHVRARWLAAAAYDRWCMYEGRPQKYGTQFVPDGERYRLWDVEAATTDAERAAWDVPALAAQLARAEEMTRNEPQPPLEGAPVWLLDALERWRRS